MTYQTHQEIRRCQEFLQRNDISRKDREAAERGVLDWFTQSLFEDGLMAQHFTKNTESVSHFCKVCNRLTMHKVFDRRLGPCVEEHVKDKPIKTETEDKQQSLFQKEAS